MNLKPFGMAQRLRDDTPTTSRSATTPSSSYLTSTGFILKTNTHIFTPESSIALTHTNALLETLKEFIEQYEKIYGDIQKE